MGTFTENMKALTDQLACCAHERADDLQALRTRTEGLLADAEEFLQHLSEEHEAMGTQVRETLSEDCRQRAEQVAEMREQISKRLQELQERFQETLRTCREARHEHVDHLLEGFEEARQELAKDLQEAGRVWRKQHGGKTGGHKRGARA